MPFDFSYPNRPADQRGWPSGYPNCHEEQWVPLVASNGVGFGRVHKGVVELLRLLLDECIRRGYPPKRGQCWGSVCRCSHRSDGSCAEDGAGRPIPSNHSYGIAIDFNSLDNPFGASTYKMPAWVPELFRDYGFRWLGPPINDWQHFDFAGTPADAKRMLRKAQRELGEEPRAFRYRGKTYKKVGNLVRALRRRLKRAKVKESHQVKVVRGGD